MTWRRIFWLCTRRQVTLLWFLCLGTTYYILIFRNRSFISPFSVQWKVSFTAFSVFSMRFERLIRVDTLKNIGSMKVDPDKRLFVVRGDYSVMEINLKLELIKLR